MIVACALAAEAEYIVTRDKDLLSLGRHQSIEMITPEAFLQVLRIRNDPRPAAGDVRSTPKGVGVLTLRGSVRYGPIATSDRSSHCHQPGIFRATKRFDFMVKSSQLPAICEPVGESQWKTFRQRCS